MYRPGPSITVKNARSVLQDGLSAIAAGQMQLDLGALTEFDSAAVATMLAWQRAAHRQGKLLTFFALPANLHALIDVYGVTELLQVSMSVDSRPH